MRKIDTGKVMFNVLFNASGMVVADFLPKGATFDAEYFETNILSKLVSYYEKKRPAQKCKNLLLHYDNARPHIANRVREFLTSNDIIRVANPAYSPDLSPSDYFLFPGLKATLEMKSYKSVDELKAEILSVFNSYDKSHFRHAFDQWIVRCKWVIENNGDYYREYKL